MTTPADDRVDEFDAKAAIQRIEANVQWLVDTLSALLNAPGIPGMMARKALKG